MKENLREGLRLRVVYQLMGKLPMFQSPIPAHAQALLVISNANSS